MAKNLKYVVDTLFKEKPKWDIEWCTREEFNVYCQYVWELNKENFKKWITYDQFFDTQCILIHEAPYSFKMLYDSDLKKFKQ